MDELSAQVTNLGWTPRPYALDTEAAMELIKDQPHVRLEKTIVGWSCTLWARHTQRSTGVGSTAASAICHAVINQAEDLGTNPYWTQDKTVPYGDVRSREYWEVEQLERRFWSRVDKREPDDCWLWVGSRDKAGYGVFKIGQKQMRASRVALMLTNRAAIPQPIIAHHCDNPSCVNPAHLFPATPAENTKDMIAKGRANRKSPRPPGTYR